MNKMVEKYCSKCGVILNINNQRNNDGQGRCYICKSCRYKKEKMIINDYLSGEFSSKFISEKYNICRGSLNYILKRHNIKSRSRIEGLKLSQKTASKEGRIPWNTALKKKNDPRLRVIAQKILAAKRKNNTLYGARRELKWDVSPNGCWICTSHKSSWGGWYPSISRYGKSESVHRYQYKKYKGEIPDGKIVRHTCDNPLCINPDHLVLGTTLDNIQDRESRNRTAYGLNNGRAKLSDKEIVEIYHNDDLKTSELAKKYGLSTGTVRNIKMVTRRQHILGNLKPKTTRKLTFAQRVKMANLDESTIEISKRYGISKSYVSALRRKYRCQNEQ